MDKITKVQEVSSFIVNFDNKYWNEVILRLTIIGIRYVTNNYRSIFSWKLKDLNNIIDKLNKTKPQKKINFKPKSKNNDKKEIKKEPKKEKGCYNCRNNSTILKHKENNSAISEKKNIISNSNSMMDLNEINFDYNDNSNNNFNDDMLLLSERNCMDNNRYYQKIKKNKEEIAYLKNKSGNNNPLSLKQSSFNYNKNKINVVMSDFPFHNENKMDKYLKNKNLIFDFNQEQRTQVNLDNIRKLRNIVKDEKINYNNDNHSYILDRGNKIYKEFLTFENKNKSTRFLEDINLLQKYNYKNSSQEFISELRKMSHSKDLLISNPKKTLQNNNSSTYYSQPKLNLSYNASFIENKNIPNKSYINNINNNITSNKAKDKFEKLNKIKSNILLRNKEYKKVTDIENKEKMISKTVNNKYNFMPTNDNLEINFQYGLNNIDINNINNLNTINKDNIEKNPIRLNNTNKYLRNPKEKLKANPATDIVIKNKPKMNFDYTFNKENNNSLNLERNYNPPNTDRYTSRYSCDIQSRSNKSIINNNSQSLSQSIIKEETKEKESEKKEDKTDNKN